MTTTRIFYALIFHKPIDGFILFLPTIINSWWYIMVCVDMTESRIIVMSNAMWVWDLYIKSFSESFHVSTYNFCFIFWIMVHHC